MFSLFLLFVKVYVNIHRDLHQNTHTHSVNSSWPSLPVFLCVGVYSRNCWWLQYLPPKWDGARNDKLVFQNRK